ncbi:exodeoxyribonuclease III [Gilliamella sp. Pas-s25]|uniref:exodeoxyribonuclease III n=1 Tax=Gilliamella sp. Pas-s25 TaxID=2687310 RepID=UPI00135E794A|nr:exodeoxyribonuclease III [Gilliamella sp. Pas-s25]MWP62584.1 exodeoxyribonuclease III [Gilliamella sp. Pas-s25]
MKVISFNINSLRARIHQLAAIIDTHQPDIIGLQETKVHNDQFPVEELAQFGYHLHYHGQKSHYGVALLTKQKPLSVQCGFPTDSDDAQCRLIIAELPTSQGKLTVINGYFPQGESLHHEIKYPAKRKFYQDLVTYINQQQLSSQLSLIMGDMNICPTDLDIGISQESRKRWLRTGKCSFLPEEREWMNRVMSLGFIDTYRNVHPTELEYSWFDYRSKGFDTHTGLRIDLILASQKMLAHCKQAGIDYDIRAMEKASDHAPIWAQFDIV